MHTIKQELSGLNTLPEGAARFRATKSIVLAEMYPVCLEDYFLFGKKYCVKVKERSCNLIYIKISEIFIK